MNSPATVDLLNEAETLTKIAEDAFTQKQLTLGARIVTLASKYELHPVDLMTAALDLYEQNRDATVNAEVPNYHYPSST